MIDLKQYGYAENEKPEKGLIVGRVTELRREQYTVITEQGEATSVLKGSFYHNAVERGDFPCVGDFVLVQHNTSENDFARNKRGPNFKKWRNDL